MNKPAATDSRQKGMQKLAVGLLLLLATGVIFVLPSLVSEPWIAGSDQSQSGTDLSSATISANTVSPSTAAQKTQYRQDAQTLLAEIIQRRDSLLNQQGVEAWGEFEFKQAQKAVERGDKEYGIGDYSDAISSYQAALDGLLKLKTKAESLLEQSIAEAAVAIENSALSTAVSAAQLAMAIAPNNPKVIRLSQRAESLPVVMDAMERGQRLIALDRLEQAKQAFTEALTADPEHRQAAAALASSEQKITEQRFRRHMSAGFSALDNNNFAAATQSFNQAGTVYKAHSAVAQALAQVETRRSQLWVSSNVAKATQLETEEKWQQATQIYQQLLTTDGSLTDIRVKQIPAKVRADLDQRIEKVLNDPLALSANSQFRRGQKVLDDASGIAKPGPRLKRQISDMQRVLKASQTPVQVVLTSDSNTYVTLFKVAKLGVFEKTAVALKPGRYIVAGTRMGFRDVRIEFTVTGEEFGQPIAITCNEAI
jgi:tetratricopeptide (TPR) repeat protein